MGRRNFIPECLVFVAICFGAYTFPVCAQLPPRLERCLPYPTIADEIRDITTTGVEETVKTKATIDDVRIDGKTHLPNDVQEQLTISILETELTGEPGHWLSGLEEVGIGGFLRNHGYFRATSRAKAELIGGDATHKHFRVRIQLDEGPQYRLEQIRFEGEKAFSEGELRSLIRLREGEVFDVSKVREGIDAIYRNYGSKGFIDATSEPNNEIDEARGRISLTIKVDEQRQYRVGQFEILGLDQELDSQLKSVLKPGEIYNSRLVYDFFKEHRAVLPSDVWPESMRVNRDARTGLLSGVFDLRTCKQFQIQN
jgi:surface antigen-like variable number repeat protein